jgi:diguanylate cyclase (GGDEF)-like protein
MLGELVLGVAVLYPFSAHETFDESVMEQVKLLARQSTLVVELARLRQEVEETRDRDDVTGVLTRRRFFELAELEYRRSWRFRQPLSALVLDIDDFRHLAQMLGPEAEERVLREVGCLSRGTLRHIDLVGRLQTDTFGILLVMTGREGVGEVAERLRRAVASIEVETPSGPWQVTASLGAAVYPREQVASVHDLFALAEQAVMTSKRAGRNRVTLV